MADLSLLCLAVFSMAASTVEGFECPEQRTQALLPDPEDCRKYYHCLPDRRVFEMQCPNGLVFDARQKICIWDSNARSCAPDHELVPIKPWQPKDKPPNSEDNSKPRTDSGPRRNENSNGKTQKEKKKTPSSAGRIQNDNGKAVVTKKPMNPWDRTTKRRPTPTTTSKPKPTVTTTTTTTTTTTPPETTTEQRKTSEIGGLQKKDEDVNLIGNILATLGLDVPSNAQNEHEQLSTENGNTAPVAPRLSGERTRSNPGHGAENQGELTNKLPSQERQLHTVRKRSPLDNMIWDDIRCPSGYAYIPDPSNCAVFYHCYNWQPMKKVCPPGLFFDDQTYVCNWPHNVNCIEGYRSKSLFIFNEYKKSNDQKSSSSMATKTTSAAHKETTKNPWKRYSKTRKVITTSVATTTTTRPSTRSTRRTTVRSPPTSTVFSPSPQQFRNNNLSFKFSDAPLQSLLGKDVNKDPSTFATSSSSFAPSSISTSSPAISSSSSLPSSSSSASTTVLSNGFRVSSLSPGLAMVSPQPRQIGDSLLREAKKEFSLKEVTSNSEEAILTNSQSRFSPTPIGKMTHTEQQFTRPLYSLNPSSRPVKGDQYQFSFSGPQQQTTSLPGTTRWHTRDFSWSVGDISNHLKSDVKAEPYANKVKDDRVKLLADEVTTSAATSVPSLSTTRTATIQTQSSIVTSSQERDISSFQPFTTNNNALTKTFINVTYSQPSNKLAETSIDRVKQKPTDQYKISNGTTTIMPVTLASATSILTQSDESQSSSLATQKETTSAVTINSTVFASTTTVSTPVTTLTSTAELSTAQAHNNLKSVTETKPTPVAFAAAKIPFYSLRNQRVQPVSWLQKDQEPLSSMAFRRGSRLRARTQNAKGRSMNASPFLRPSIANSKLPTAFRKRFASQPRHPEGPEDVQMEKFMIKLLNDAMKSKHVVSRDASHIPTSANMDRRVSVTYEQTTDGLKEQTAAKVGQLDENTSPTLFLQVHSQEDFSNANNVQDISVVDKTNTHTNTSVFSSTDNDDNLLKSEGFVNAARNLPSAAALQAVEEDSENLVKLEEHTDEVFDKGLLPDEKSGKLNQKTLELTGSDGIQDEQLDYSGDIDGDLAIPPIQVFSALSGQSFAKNALKENEEEAVKDEQKPMKEDEKQLVKKNEEKEEKNEEKEVVMLEDEAKEMQKDDEKVVNNDEEKLVTKEDEEKLVTKEDEAKLVTKESEAKLVTKEDEAKLVTKGDEEKEVKNEREEKMTKTDDDQVIQKESEPLSKDHTELDLVQPEQSTPDTNNSLTTINTSSSADTIHILQIFLHNASAQSSTAKVLSTACNNVSCSLNVSEAAEPRTKENVTEITATSSSNSTNTSEVSTSVPGAIEVVINGNTTLLKIEAYLAKDALKLQRTEEETDSNRVDVDNSEDSDIVKDDKLGNELDGIKPKPEKELANQAESNKLSMSKSYEKTDKVFDSVNSEATNTPSEDQTFTKEPREESVFIFNSTLTTEYRNTSSLPFGEEENATQSAHLESLPPEVKSTPEPFRELSTSLFTDNGNSSTSSRPHDAELDQQFHNLTNASAIDSISDARDVLLNVTLITEKISIENASTKIMMNDEGDSSISVLPVLLESLQPEEKKPNTETANATLSTITTTNESESLAPSTNSSQSTTTKTNRTESSIANASDRVNDSATNDTVSVSVGPQMVEETGEVPETYLSADSKIASENQVSVDDKGTISSVSGELEDRLANATNISENFVLSTSTVSANENTSSVSTVLAEESSTVVNSETIININTEGSSFDLVTESNSSTPLTNTNTTVVFNVTSTTSAELLRKEEKENQKLLKSTEPDSATDNMEPPNTEIPIKEPRTENGNDTNQDGEAPDAGKPNSNTTFEMNMIQYDGSQDGFDFKATSLSANINAQDYEQLQDSQGQNALKDDNYESNDVTTENENTGSKKSFVSLTDLITWYLKHWRNYSKWRQDQTSVAPTVTY